MPVLTFCEEADPKREMNSVTHHRPLGLSTDLELAALDVHSDDRGEL